MSLRDEQGVFMDEVSAQCVFGKRVDAHDKARVLQMTEGYGLQNSVAVDGGYEFTYVRNRDQARVVIVLRPNSPAEEPFFVIAHRDDAAAPIWQRIVLNISFASHSDAASYLATELGGDPDYEVRPHLNTLGS